MLESALRGALHLGVGRLGLGVPAWPGVLAAAVVCLLLTLVIPIYYSRTGASFAIYPGWTWLLPGMFFQGGIGEEALFRGYGFRHVRQGRSSWNAAVLAMGPFVLVHLALFATMAWPVALASLLLAVVISFPLAHFFEPGRNTIWGPALVHWVVQAGVKIIAIEQAGPLLPLVWIAAWAVVPCVAFLWWR